MPIYKIKGWSKFQHFRDRTPPWIKLYRDLLDDKDFHELPGDAAKTLVMLWLIASEDENHEGTLPPIDKLAFRLRVSEAFISKQIQALSGWLIRDDITMISPRYHDDTPEGERERETEESIARSRQTVTEPKPVARIQFDESSKNWTGITDEHRALWARAYPAVNVNADLARAAAWYAANPAKRKKHLERFLANWLSRSQEKGGDTPARRTSTSALPQYWRQTGEHAAEMDKAF